MKNRAGVIIVAVLVLVAGVVRAQAYEAIVGPTGVLLYDREHVYEGYTLFSPMGSRTVYLIDMQGNVVHTWKTAYTPGSFAMMLENGNLLRGGVLGGSPAAFGGAGGIVQEIDWDGNVVWEYKLQTPDAVQHHAFTRMPNGNTLILAWERISADEFIARGREPRTIPVAGAGMNGRFNTDFWVDFVREVNPAGETVWQWRAWDHVGTGPFQFDLNYTVPDTMAGSAGYYDWTHFNAVEYLPETDQIILSSRNFSEIYFVDRKTGRMVYRWGNPSAYGQGEAPSWLNNGDQKMFGNHNVTHVGGTRFMIFDNGSERPEGNRSAVIEIDITTGNIVWEYTAPTSNSFYTARQGAAQRLPNGNTLVTSSNHGHLFEVTREKKVVWDYVNPLVGEDQIRCFLGGEGLNFNMIHRAYRYGKDFPGFAGKDLSRKTPLAKGCPEFYRIYKTDQPPPTPKKDPPQNSAPKQ
ncbi:MAG TPA: aryl-sulfate sulfotransferase [Acidobacteriota bacterium]|nr:aryl-sulfate sulfotransferase [Acidobacteriota bacterium]